MTQSATVGDARLQRRRRSERAADRFEWNGRACRSRTRDRRGLRPCGVHWRVHLSNAPDAPARDQSRTRHLRNRPVSLGRRRSSSPPVTDVIVHLEAALAGDDYVWNWKTCVLDQGRDGAEKASFSQSTFFGAPLSAGSPAQAGRELHAHAQRAEGRIARFVLDSMSRRIPLGEIARAAFDRNLPGVFSVRQETLSYVADLAQRYS